MPVNGNELFDIVDESGCVIGCAPRSQCHGNPSLIHRTVHVFVFHPDGRSLLLQLRAADKDIQPGKWDTSVGGHLDHGEDFETAAKRELSEELGFVFGGKLKFLFDSRIRNSIESENTRVFGITADGPFHFQRSEIDAIRFWTWDDLHRELSSGAASFTPNLVAELNLLAEKKFIPNL